MAASGDARAECKPARRLPSWVVMGVFQTRQRTLAVWVHFLCVYPQIIMYNASYL